MADAITSILKKLLKQPTAPFHEYYVRAEILRQLEGTPNVTTKLDDYGNVIASYRKGTAKTARVWTFGAHMDHPGWVKNSKGEWEFLGGIPKTVIDNPDITHHRKVVGEFATFDFAVHIEDRECEIEDDDDDDTSIVLSETVVEAAACDDLVGCSTIIAVFKELARLDLDAHVNAVFTRAEEIGFLGAWHVGQNWPFGDNSVFLSIETSRPVNGAEMGEGPILRVGDRLSVFDHELVSILNKTASEQAIRIQRCLLDAGACEASAIQACGIRSAGISIPLGNYHNLDDNDRTNVTPEYVMLSDVEDTVKLLVALVAMEHKGIAEPTMAERVAIRQNEYKEHQETGNKAFENFKA